jgi:hypothetical protein
LPQRHFSHFSHRHVHGECFQSKLKNFQESLTFTCPSILRLLLPCLCISTAFA